MKRTYFIIALLIFLSFGKIDDEVAFEQAVFNEVFIKAVNATYRDKRTYCASFNPKIKVYNKGGKFIGRDTTGQKGRILDHKLKMEGIRKDTFNLVIAIDDFAEPITPEEEEQIQKYCLEFGLIYSRPKTHKSYRLDLTKSKSEKFLFKYVSELPKSGIYESPNFYDIWSNKYEKFAGYMSFSRINFDTRKEHGVFRVSYSGAPKCGVGYLIYIKKINNKWVIDKVIQNSQA